MQAERTVPGTRCSFAGLGAVGAMPFMYCFRGLVRSREGAQFFGIQTCHRTAANSVKSKITAQMKNYSRQNPSKRKITFVKTRQN
jgi:hypothetical protein